MMVDNYADLMPVMTSPSLVMQSMNAIIDFDLIFIGVALIYVDFADQCVIYQIY